MSVTSKPLWTEGLLIRPHHFQQHDRWIEHLVENRVAGIQHSNWGLQQLEINRELLGLGQFALRKLVAIMPDGTVIDLPSQGPLPDPVQLKPATRNAIVKISVPARPLDSAEVSTDKFVRRRYQAADQIVRNSTAPELSSSTLSIGRLSVEILIDPISEDGLITLPVAKIDEVSPTGSVTISPTFIAPCLDFHSSPRLLDIVNETRSLLKARGDALAARSEYTRSASESAGILDMLSLVIINGQESVFDHLASLKGAHPVAVFEAMLLLTAQLSSFSGNRRKSSDLPAYLHHDIEACISPLSARLRELLSVVIERNAVPLELQSRGYGIMTSIVADRSLFQDSRFVLTAVASVDSETLRSKLPSQMKIGSVEQIRDLVNFQLPGIPIRALAVAPPELPFLQNGVYFELDQSAELWRTVIHSAAIAMHLSGEHPDLHMEFWAIRKKRT